MKRGRRVGFRILIKRQANLKTIVQKYVVTTSIQEIDCMLFESRV